MGKEVHLLQSPPGEEWGGGIYALLIKLGKGVVEVGSLGRISDTP